MAGVGRPTLMTPETLAKLEEAFSVGATDLEACFLANISKDTLYNYQKKHPEFVERKEALKNMPNYKAKKVVVKAIEDGDKSQANWWLERKGKDDGFSQRQELDATVKDVTPIYDGKSNIPIQGHTSDQEDIQPEEEN